MGIRFNIFLAFFLISFAVFAQQGNNPFQVYHQNEKEQKDTLAVNDSNLSDIAPIAPTTVVKSDIEGQVLPTSLPVETIVQDEESRAATAPVVNTSQQIPPSLDNNPFSVRHSTTPSAVLDESVTTNTKNEVQEADSPTQPEVIGETVIEGSTSPVATSPTSTEGGSTNPFQTGATSATSESKESTTNEAHETIVSEANSTAGKEKMSNSNSTHSNSNSKEGMTSVFIFWVLFFTIFLFAILINYKRSFILNSYRGILNENYLKLIKRDENNGSSLFFMSLFFVFLLNLSSFVYLYLSKIKGYDIGAYFFLKIFIVLFGIYFIRSIVLRVIAYIFGIKKPIEKYYFTLLFYNVLLGISLLVVNVGFAFGTDSIVQMSIYLGVFLIGISVFIRYVRGFLLSIQHGFLLKVHFFFYLCGVEIAPLLFFIKYMSNSGLSFM